MSDITSFNLKQFPAEYKWNVSSYSLRTEFGVFFNDYAIFQLSYV